MALARCEEYLQIIVGEILCSKVMVAVETLRGLQVFALAGFGSSLPVVSISPLITSVKSGRKTRVKVSNSSYKQLRPAIIEVRQQTLEDDGREIVALLLKGRFSGAGVTQEASGELIKLPEEDCIDSYEDFVKQFTSSWIGVISIGSSSSQSSSSNEDPESDRNTTDRYTVLEKVKKAMMLGASAIIILVLNPKILQELDVAQILIKPLVLVEDSDNITILLNALRSKMKLRLRVTSGSISIYDTQTFTVWSACWRARPGSGVVCKSDNRLSKADPSLFWSYFYSAIAVVILLLLLKTNHRNENEENHEDSQTVHTIARMALSLLKTRRYKDKTYWSSESKHGDERDSCAICLDIFHRRQILRVLPCLHEFHSKCVDQWLLCHQTCPLCKSNINFRSMKD